jgi:Zn-dependent alcohol dehydrogenase
MPLDKAALIGCSVMTGVGAVITAQVPAGASMAVWGAGGIGLNCIQGGVLANAHPIIAVTSCPEARLRRRPGRQPSDQCQLRTVEAIRQLTTRGADFCRRQRQGDRAPTPPRRRATAPHRLPPTGSMVQLPPANREAPIGFSGSA